ncbi:hypothetical protein AX774_g2709 [Zancudomyces culisetae]|uniref:Uncharacterized protein n=1 Tax=Zancudomyces culisetae TaxID=1213189 RepID=A0A1R1PSB3_ZANCU|nr:hypothetical protein AX774_g2709 [Zancudomyces culisetae]|eukprot:OMH83783.1 hypothetical protein AX774_g2709 [Zancudomyces culisetae]
MGLEQSNKQNPSKKGVKSKQNQKKNRRRMAEKAKYEVVDELIRGVGKPPKNPVNLGIKYRTNSGARHYQVGYGSRKSSGDHREKGTDLLRGAKRRRLSGVPEQNPQPRGRVREIQNNLNGRGKRKSISVELGEGKFNNRNILNSIITDHKKSGEKEVQGRDEEKVKGNKVEKEQSIEVITESFTKSKEDPQPIAKIHDKRGIIKVYDLSTDSEEDEPGEGVINEDTMKDVEKNKGNEGEEEVTEIKETPLKESKNSADTTQKSELMEIIDTTSESASASESESGSKSEPELGSGFKSDSERDGDSFFSILKQDAAKSSNSCVGVAIKLKDSSTVVIGSRVEQKSSESIEIHKKSYEKQQSKGKSVQSNELEKRVEENLNIGPNKRELRRRTIGLAFPSHQPLVINRLKTKEQSTSKQVNSEDVTVMYKDRSTHNRMKGEMGPGNSDYWWE